MHFHFGHAVALTRTATPAVDIERKTARAVTTLTRHGHLGHQLAQRREQAGIGDRVGARRAAYGGLIDIDDFVKVVKAEDVVMRRRFFVGAVDLSGDCGIQSVIHQSGFARA